MEITRLNSSESVLFQSAMQLYRLSFPYHEQREDASQRRLLRTDEYHFNLIYDEGLFVGLILCWEPDQFTYVEHFCILPAMRSKGYGKRALDFLISLGKPVILEIDPPYDSISMRRKEFYKRSGFHENSFEHLHPPYHKGYAGHKLIVMSAPEGLPLKAYQTFKRYLDETVMSDL